MPHHTLHEKMRSILPRNRPGALQVPFFHSIRLASFTLYVRATLPVREQRGPDDDDTLEFSSIGHTARPISTENFIARAVSCIPLPPSTMTYGLLRAAFVFVRFGQEVVIYRFKEEGK
jgi:hypothetical protein